jgi:hypothetical protein
MALKPNVKINTLKHRIVLIVWLCIYTKPLETEERCFALEE